MPEDERIETLKDLEAAKEVTNAELEKLPVVAHSAKMERHKKELEDKMGRLDKAIETFSKKTVYVAMWDKLKANIFWYDLGHYTIKH